MKFFASFSAILALIAVAAASTADFSIRASLEKQVAARDESNNLIVGKRHPNDKLMYQENINKRANIVGKKTIYEEVINVPRDHVITAVRALDMMTDGTGAFVVVTGGGPGQESVSLRFKSQRFHGIYFIVQVYAKPRYQ
ncbi:probable salivary secreted peptide [Nasonia vitripennis]|uniref:Uncharacterized protein n=1 Tax=Nasonia vitripennis TaxID=7425 RepID=A0A7M7GKJ8_NASVI|nr:probable salivary secreted peptide [Nasonia vitripennis]